MVGSLGAVTAVAGIGLAFDPTTQPTRASFWVFVFLAGALVLLMISMVRHMRRAERNLGPAAAPPGASSEAGTPTAGSARPGGSAQVESERPDDAGA